MIWFIQPSSVCGVRELELGVRTLAELGFDSKIHPQCRKQNLFYAGDEATRVKAFLEAANSDAKIIWSARGGYGAIRLLEQLRKAKKPRASKSSKLFVGYSDATALFDFLRTEWGWSVLHAPMPGLRAFHYLSAPQIGSLVRGLRGEIAGLRYPRLKVLNPGLEVKGEIVGGNLCTLASLVGSGDQPLFKGKVLFLEEVDEQIYRVDRFVTQLDRAGLFKGIKALVLGTFENCKDAAPRVLKDRPTTVAQARQWMEEGGDFRVKPLRKPIDPTRFLKGIFGEAGKRHGFPVFWGLPVGHGLSGQTALPIGAQVVIGSSGQFEVSSWDWKLPSASS